MAVARHIPLANKTWEPQSQDPSHVLSGNYGEEEPMGSGKLLPAGGTKTDVCMCELPAYPQDHLDGGDLSDRNGLLEHCPGAHASGTPVYIILKTPFPEDSTKQPDQSPSRPQASKARAVLDTVLQHWSGALQNKTTGSHQIVVHLKTQSWEPGLPPQGPLSLPCLWVKEQGEALSCQTDASGGPQSPQGYPEWECQQCLFND